MKMKHNGIPLQRVSKVKSSVNKPVSPGLGILVIGALHKDSRGKVV